MDIVRLIMTACVVVGLIFIGALIFDPARGQDLTAWIRSELQGRTNSADLTQRVEDALSRNDYDEAAMYADIAEFTGIPLAPDVQARFTEQASGVRALATGTDGFIDATRRDAPTNTSALAGAVASDLTMIGDLRDIGLQGARMRDGRPYDELLIELSVVGLALTSQFSASAAPALPAKVGVSVLKAADRADTLSPDFLEFLRPRLERAVDLKALAAALKGVDLEDAMATRKAAEGVAAHTHTAAVFTTLTRIEAVRNAAGAGEAVRLLAYVRGSDDLEALVRLTQLLGPKTRGVIELTGATSPHLFKHFPSLVSLVASNIGSLVAWGVSLLAIFLSRRMFSFAGA